MCARIRDAGPLALGSKAAVSQITEEDRSPATILCRVAPILEGKPREQRAEVIGNLTEVRPSMVCSRTITDTVRS